MLGPIVMSRVAGRFLPTVEKVEKQSREEKKKMGKRDKKKQLVPQQVGNQSETSPHLSYGARRNGWGGFDLAIARVKHVDFFYDPPL